MLRIVLISFLIALSHSVTSKSFELRSSKTGFDGKKAGVMPGDTILLFTGHWHDLKIRNVVGSASQPVIIINYGGVAEIGNTDFYFGFILEFCQYFKLSGRGAPDYKYGIKITGTQKGSGVSLRLCSDFEIEYLEVTKTGFAGITAKTDPTCDSATWKENFTMRNVIIHDNYIHHTATEGMYIGPTRLHGFERVCDGVKKRVFAHEIKTIRVYNNLIESPGWDGIQVSMANEDCEIYSNTITDFGAAKHPIQDCGLVIGGGTTGKVYNNRIIRGTGQGISVFGMGENYIFNNLIYGAGVDGIFIQDRKTVKPGWGFHVVHNTIVSPGRDGIRMYSDESTGNEFCNNIIVNPGSFKLYETYKGFSGKDAFILVLRDRKIDLTATNNYLEPDLAKAGFRDPDNLDFRLTTGSPAINVGKPYFKQGIELDYNAVRRNQDIAPDAGMYEFKD